MNTVDRPSNIPRSPGPWSSRLWLLLTTFGLLLLSEAFRAAPCWVAPLLAVVPAYPLWLASRERFLFDRRVVLTGATHTDGRIRRWLWTGQLGSVLRVPYALALSILLLAVATRLNAQEWMLLFADALLVVWLYQWLARRTATEVRPGMLGVVVRGWPLRWLNLGLLTLAFFALSFFLLGAPDLRQTSWQAVADQAFSADRQTLTCAWSGWLVGGLSALEQGSWALAQRYIPALPSSAWRLLAWGVFLLQLSLVAFLFTRLLLGVLVLIEGRTQRAEAFLGEGTTAKTFISTILLLALASVYGALQFRDLDPDQFGSPAREALTWIDPCGRQPAGTAPTTEVLHARLQNDQRALVQAHEQRVAREIDALFAPVDAQVEAYLDWYFTVVGEYERLQALVVGEFPRLMAEQLETHLFVATDFQARLQAVEMALMDDSRTQLSALSRAVHTEAAMHERADPCLSLDLDPARFARIERDAWRVGTASVGGVVGATLSQKVMAGVVAKVGAKKSVQAAAVMGAKLAAKKGGGVLAGVVTGLTVCAPSGPWAVACGIGAGVATWVAIDKVAIEIDEAVSREAMRTEILAVLAEEREALKVALLQRHLTILAPLVADLQTTIDGLFIPARDGL